MSLIKREEISSQAAYLPGCGEQQYVPLSAIEKAEAVDAVPRSEYEQMRQERDTAIKQLAEIGIGLGEKTAEVRRVVYG